MPVARDLTKRKFGRLGVVRRLVERSRDGRIRWLCRCHCGGVTATTTSALLSGNTTSCGCQRADSNRRDVIERFLEKVRKTKKCWLWIAGTNEWGYGTFSVNGEFRLAHRAAYELFVGPVPVGKGVLHSCDTPACVRPDHLRPGTDADNTGDRFARGRMTVVYSRKVVDEVIAAVANGTSQAEMARRTGMSPAQVCRIVNGTRRARIA